MHGEGASRFDMKVRPFDRGAGDSYEALTDLLHRAYAPLAAAGMRFYATHQSVEDTRMRAEEGTCFVSEIDGVVVATLSLRRSSSTSRCTFYREPRVWIFGQFAVEPAHQRAGLGGVLLDHAEHVARAGGAHELACDTAETATHLVRYYAARGYREVDRVQWEVTNYRSVVLSKVL
jgi:GNAT superfamily N-acetyltransferase